MIRQETIQNRVLDFNELDAIYLLSLSTGS
jgi:hypothetical protein